MRVALDTNILAYAEGVGDEARCQRARTLITELIHRDVVLPAQTLGELSRAPVVGGEDASTAPQGG